MKRAWLYIEPWLMPIGAIGIASMITFVVLAFLVPDFPNEPNSPCVTTT